MVAITTCGYHLPRYRIGTDAIRERWGGGSAGVRTKTVPAADDDAVTLAVEAGQRVLDGDETAGALFFATTTPTYEYGEVAPALVEALGLPADAHTATFDASRRAGTAALRAAAAHVAAWDEAAVVLAAEAPRPEPRTDREKTAGSAAAALVLAPGDDGLSLAATGSRSRPLAEEWQASGGPRHSGDDRFGRDVGYVDTASAAVEGALADAGWTADDVDAVVVDQPNAKHPRRLVRSLGVDGDRLVAADLAADHGDLGSASALAGLANADPGSGDRVVVAAYGSGVADALAFEAASPPTTHRPAPDAPTVDLSYLDYLEHADSL